MQICFPRTRKRTGRPQTEPCEAASTTTLKSTPPNSKTGKSHFLQALPETSRRHLRQCTQPSSFSKRAPKRKPKRTSIRQAQRGKTCDSTDRPPTCITPSEKHPHTLSEGHFADTTRQAHDSPDHQNNPQPAAPTACQHAAKNTSAQGQISCLGRGLWRNAWNSMSSPLTKRPDLPRGENPKPFSP